MKDHECPRYENYACCLRVERERLRAENEKLKLELEELKLHNGEHGCGVVKYKAVADAAKELEAVRKTGDHIEVQKALLNLQATLSVLRSEAPGLQPHPCRATHGWWRWWAR